MESTKEYMSKLTDEQREILAKYDVTEEDLWDMKQSLLYGTSDRDYQKEMIIKELTDRKIWSKAYEKWMDELDERKAMRIKRQREWDKCEILHALNDKYNTE